MTGKAKHTDEAVALIGAAIDFIGASGVCEWAEDGETYCHENEECSYCRLAIAVDNYASGDVRQTNQLISAAPDLLRALQRAEQLADDADDWDLQTVKIDGELIHTRNMRDEFRAVIKKAGGG